MVISSCQRPTDIRADFIPTTAKATTIATNTTAGCAIRAELLNKLEEAGKLMLPKRSEKSSM